MAIEYVLLHDPLGVPDSEVLRGAPLGYRGLVAAFGPGEFNGEVHLLPPEEVVSYADLIPSPDVAEMREWKVFAASNNGACVAWSEGSDVVAWIPPRCLDARELVELSVGNEWSELFMDPRLRPRGHLTPYFIPRGCFDELARVACLAPDAELEESHGSLREVLSNADGWIVLRSDWDEASAETRVARLKEGVATITTVAPEQVSGATDSDVAFRADQEGMASFRVALVHIMQESEWLFE